MKIATWNIERPTGTTKRNAAIIEILREVNADLLILTETNDAIELGDEYQVIHSLPLPKPIYKEGERRVSFFSKYPIVGELNTFKDDTSKCVKVQTPFGDLAVYGTIIGIEGNRRQSFLEDLELQLLDIGNIAASNHVCIAGDLNISFTDNFYFTEAGRSKLIASFGEHDLVNLTAAVKDNIDHIVLSKSFVGEKKVVTEIWNRPINKSLSDHIGVSITIS